MAPQLSTKHASSRIHTPNQGHPVRRRLNPAPSDSYPSSTFSPPAGHAIASPTKRCKCKGGCPDHAGRPCDGFVTAKKKVRCSACQLAADRRRSLPIDRECKHVNCRQPVTKQRQALCNHHLHLKTPTNISYDPCNCARSNCHGGGLCPNPRAPKQAICQACKCTENRLRRANRTVEELIGTTWEGVLVAECWLVV